MSGTTAGQLVTSGSVQTVYDPAADATGQRATKIQCWNADGTNSVKVNVAGLHFAGDYHVLGPGQWTWYGSTNVTLGKVTALAVAGSPALNWGIIERN